MIRHVVLLRFADPADAPEARSRLLALEGAVPSLRSIEVGLDVLRTEASYDLALITTHDHLDALEAYQTHPAHQDFLGWARPRLSARAVADVEP